MWQDLAKMHYISGLALLSGVHIKLAPRLISRISAPSLCGEIISSSLRFDNKKTLQTATLRGNDNRSLPIRKV